MVLKCLIIWKNISQHDLSQVFYDMDVDYDNTILYNDNNEISDNLYDGKETDTHFLNGYIIYESHCIHFDSRKKDVVPNFIGGLLPGCNKGDR